MKLQSLPNLHHESLRAFAHGWSQESASCSGSPTGTELTGWQSRDLEDLRHLLHLDKFEIESVGLIG